MHLSRALTGLFLALVIGGLVITHARRDDTAAPTTADLVRLWDAGHVSAPYPPLLTHRDVVAQVTQVTAKTPDLFAQEEIGRSVEGRSLHHLWFGRGATHVLLWSQMHGDEPTATAALFDLYEYVRARRDTPVVRRLLDALTIHTVPMLNPDGAERYQRRNAQEIDINRDALRLQTPEGRALKALRDRLEPVLGFNLHNQNWRTSVGSPPKPASISLLAVAFDEQRRDNPRRILAKQVSGVIRDAIEPLIPGQIGRYDDEFEVRAFGDNITKWGTAVVLIETGPAPGPEPDRLLVRTNFVALVTALDALASGRAARTDPQRYESLPFNESRLLHTLIRNATVVAGTGVAPYLADIGIGGTRVVRRASGAAAAGRGARTRGSDGAAASGGTPVDGGRAAASATGTGPGPARTLGLAARIEDIGDLRTYGALETIDASGLTAAPLWDDDLSVGQEVRLPDWSAYAGQTLTMGAPGDVVLLAPIDRGIAAAPGAASETPAGAGAPGPASAARYRVERLIRFDEPVRK